MRNRRLVPVLALLLATSTGPVQTVSGQPGCDPFTTPPIVDPTFPTLGDVAGFEFGEQEVTVAQSNAYLALVDAESDRVVTASAATSVGGLDIPYAVVGTEAGIRRSRRRSRR